MKHKISEEQFIRKPEIMRKIVVALFATFLSTAALTNPQVNNIAAGRINIQQSPNSTVINQSSQRGIINWRNFNIGKQESTHFQQPQGGITLNRISPLDGVSQIYGRLSATGKIILINPAGIYFGPSSFVSVGGLMATTADITNRDFLKGNYQFNNVSGYSGAVVNEGRIVAANHGLVALVAPSVVNSGKIEARLGHVVLASGDAFTLNFSGDGLINFAVTAKTSRAGVDRNGRTLTDGVRNTGSLIADGGKVLVTAKAASGVLDNVINMQGIVEARSVSQKNGEIIFSGDPDGGVVKVAANINASGKGRGETGGKVKITGHDVLIDSPTVIDVSGDVGGGDIYIGGNYKGGGPLPNAKATVVMPDTKLLADAITRGPGGNVIVWSDDVTKAYGKISVKGGAYGGHGGFVETSGHNYLDVAGIKVDTSAPRGKKGTWLLDPRNVFITTADTTGGTFSGANPNIFTPSSDDSNILNTDIMNNLATANVFITTGATGTQAGNISVNAPITWASANTLRLDAFNKIFLNANIRGLNGTLELSAANIPKSITSGTDGSPNPSGVMADINVRNFRLLQGEWYQNNADLPTFNVTNNFNLAKGGTINGTFNATFTRVAGGDGGASPYQITDKYGLEGIATLALTNNYVLNNDINLAGTSGWNDGLGFLPISPPSRNSVFAYLGTFDGQNHVLSNIVIDNPGGLTDAGLFVNLGPTSVIKNLGLIDVAVSSFVPDDSSVGSLAGANSGTLTNVYAIGGSVTSTSRNTRIGGLVGINFGNGVISNAYSDIDVNYIPDGPNAGLDRSGIGGLAGMNINAGIIHDAYSLGSITLHPSANNTSVGGFVGFNTATINRGLGATVVNANPGSGNQIGGFVGLQVAPASLSNSFWDTDRSGQAQGFGFNLGSITNLKGGCFSGVCAIAPGANSSNPGAPVNLSTSSTYSGAGWQINTAPDVSSTWNIVNDRTYPFLSAISSAVSGHTGVASVNPIQLAAYGIDIQSLTTDGTGTFFGVVPYGQLILAYSPGSTGAIGNTLFDVPQGNNPTANAISLIPNTVLIDSSLSPSNSSIGATTEGITSGILYSLSGSNLTLDNNVNFTSLGKYTLNGEITTSGSGDIKFLSPVRMTTNASLTSENGTISFNKGIIGGHNLSLTSLGNGDFELTGPFNLQRVSVDGLGGNNQLALFTPDNQVWRILGVNDGNISNISGINNFTFDNIENLQGGSGNNTYIFSDQARLSGSIVGGTNSNATNTLNFVAYQTPINVSLNNNIFSGDVRSGNQRITDFSVINNLIANGGLDNTLTLPDISSTLVITGQKQGFVEAPLFFNGFNTFVSRGGNDTVIFNVPSVASGNNQVFVEGSPLFFTDFDLGFLSGTTDISNVIQQTAGNLSGFSNSLTWSTTSVSQNLDEFMKKVAELYDAKLDKVEINPHCGG